MQKLLPKSSARASSCSKLSNKLSKTKKYKEFLGYHGTDKESAEDLIKNGLNEQKAGTGQGLARATGFYVARDYTKAEEYAEQSTIIWVEEDPNGIPFDVAKKENKLNDAGQKAIVAVFTTKILNHTIDYYEGQRYIKQGLICSDGDPHGDAKVIRNSQLDPIPAKELELVIRPKDYNAIIIELVNDNFETSLKGNFVSHEDPF